MYAQKVIRKIERLIGNLGRLTEDHPLIVRGPDLTGGKKATTKEVHRRNYNPQRIYKLKQQYLTAKQTYLNPQDTTIAGRQLQGYVASVHYIVLPCLFVVLQ